MRVRGIRGATQIDTDNPEQIVDSVSELLTQMLAVNQIEVEGLISIIFTSTPDLTSEFPAVAARKIGLVMYRDWETDRKSTRLNSSHRL